MEPASDREADWLAARFADGLYHRWYLDPLYRGSYPEDIEARLNLPEGLVRPGDLAVIGAATRFPGSQLLLQPQHHTSRTVGIDLTAEHCAAPWSSSRPWAGKSTPLDCTRS